MRCRTFPSPGPRLREGGVVLITGGTGGLGLAFAGALFDLCRARVVLTARWDPPPEETWPERAQGGDSIGRSLAGVLALRARGAEVCIVAADVADAAQVARAVEATKARFGGLHGVIHAAGALDPMPAIDKVPASAARVFGPKVHGAFHLEALLGDEPLDFVLQISSQASQSPAPGQVDYAAANAVLDALAQNRAERVRGLSCAIGWGAWQDIGLAVRRLRQTLAAGADPAGRSGTGEGSGSVEDVVALDHPILRSRARRADAALTYRGELRRGHWLVDDHRLEGRPLLSGTTTLQLVLTAFRDHSTEAGAVELTRVAFQRPLFTDERGTQIEIGFSAAGKDETFTLRSRPLGSDQDWQVNSTGYVRRGVAAPRPNPTPPAPEAWGELARRPRFGGRYLSGGPRWQWRRVVTDYEGHVWKRVSLPPEFVSDLADFDLHPALLDGALSGTVKSGSGAEYVPHTYDCVRIFGPLAPEVLGITRRRSLGNADAADTTITDLEGTVLVEVEGQVWRPLDGSSLIQESRERTSAGPARPARVSGPRRVVVTELGDLDSLRVDSFAPRAPRPGEVEIEVRAAGLNFKDVLCALGEMPEVGAGPFAPGGECSGIVRAVGSGVRGLAPGDAVVAIARAAIGTHVTTAAHAVAAMPANLDFDRAAGVPIVFLTAQYALETLARLAPGERVLIHAAAGGVGLAAIQIARLLGAEVFATAGRPDKRDHLRSLGVEHVFDSRSLAFVDAIRAATGGEGVDVVLNSLAGEFIPAGLGLLRSGGRWVEIGKRDLQADTALHLSPFLRNLTFTAFDLGRIVDERHAMLPPMFDSLLDRFARGELRPLPTTVIPFERAAEGFRRMARAQHIGKIVFSVGAEDSPDGVLARAFGADLRDGRLRRMGPRGVPAHPVVERSAAVRAGHRHGRRGCRRRRGAAARRHRRGSGPGQSRDRVPGSDDGGRESADRAVGEDPGNLADRDRRPVLRPGRRFHRGHPDPARHPQGVRPARQEHRVPRRPHHRGHRAADRRPLRLDEVRESDVNSPLICTLSPAGEGLPFFIVPSVGSTPLALVRLARSIAPRRVVHAFSFAGMEDDLPPHRTVEAMATAYVAEVLACSPCGPYLLGGHCFGGAVALEMALRLEARGETVARLVALDSIPPPLAIAAPGHDASTGAEPMCRALENHGRRVLETVVARARGNHAKLPAGVARRLGGMLTLHIEAAIAYRTGRLRAPVHVLSTGGDGDALIAGWAAIAGSGVSGEKVPGDTFSMLAPPQVEVVGRCLGAALEAAER